MVDGSHVLHWTITYQNSPGCWSMDTAGVYAFCGYFGHLWDMWTWALSNKNPYIIWMSWVLVIPAAESQWVLSRKDSRRTSHTQSKYRYRVKARIDMPHLLYLSKCLQPNSKAVRAAQPHLLYAPGPSQMHISNWLEHRFIPALWPDVKFEPLHSSVYTSPKWKCKDEMLVSWHLRCSVPHFEQTKNFMVSTLTFLLGLQQGLRHCLPHHTPGKAGSLWSRQEDSLLG